jgi:hypothetical protein
MELKNINIEGLEYLQITPDGQVYNTRTKNWLKAWVTQCKYYAYALTPDTTKKRRHYLIHRLVAYTYIGKPENPKLEVDHIDENKGNNHYSNLQWITHSANVSKSFKLGKRGCYWKDKTKPSPSIETIRKMSDAKLKPIEIYRHGIYIKTCKSVQDTANYFNLTRVSIFFIMRKGGNYKEYTLKYITDK